MDAMAIHSAIKMFRKETASHSLSEEPQKGVGTSRWFPWCLLWLWWCVCQSLMSAQWPSHAMHQLSPLQKDREVYCSVWPSCLSYALWATTPDVVACGTLYKCLILSHPRPLAFQRAKIKDKNKRLEWLEVWCFFRTFLHLWRSLISQA